MKQFSSISTQDFDRERWRENSSTWPLIINRSEKVFKKLVEEVPHMKKQQLATNLAKMPISKWKKKYHPCMDSIMKKNQVKYRKSVIQKYMERMRKRNYKTLLTALETSPHYFLWLLGTALSIRNLKLK